MKLRIPGLSAIVLAALPSPAFAWNDLGHMSVAATAWERMTPIARSRAIALLRLNPDYDRWVAGVAPDKRDAFAFVRAATWPDHIKDKECPRPPHPATPGCYTNSGYRPADAGDRLNIGYADRDLRLYWHFKNTAFSSDGTPLKPPFAFNAETQIIMFIAALGDPALNAEARSFDLTWLLHLVGDVHQPLHAVARFTHDGRDGDSGGNGVTLCPPSLALTCSKEERRTLHSYWDGALGQSRKPAAAFAIAARYQGFTPSAAELAAPPAAWIEESAAAARRFAYAAPIGPSSATYSIAPNSTYARDTGSVSEQRVRLAGARLAEILNQKLI